MGETPTRRALHLMRGDALSLGLLGAWVTWATVSAAAAGSALAPTSPYVVAPLCLLAGVVCGRACARVQPRTGEPVGWLLSVVTFVAVAAALRPGPGGAPLGYANANASFFIVLIGLCGLAVPAAAGRPRRAMWIGVALLVVLVFATHSRAGLALVGPVAMTVAAARAGLVRRWMIVPASALAPIVAAWQVVELAGKTHWPAWAERAFDDVRHDLWRAAWGAWQAHPMLGIGPENARTLTRWGLDPDTVASHSAVLQIGAETGWIGVGLAVLIWLRSVLLFRDTARADAAILAVTWAAVLVHAQVDHVLDFGPVVFCLALGLGWAQARGRARPLTARRVARV